MTSTTAPALGTMRVQEDGRVALRFERRLAHAPDRVWRALTEQKQLDGWFPAVVDLAQPAGSKLTFRPTTEQKARFDLPEPEEPNGEITRADRPRTLEYTWDQEVFRWEIEADRDGSRLVFTNILVTNVAEDPRAAASIAAGWHAGLEVFEAKLDGRPVDWNVWDRAEALGAPYTDAFA